MAEWTARLVKRFDEFLSQRISLESFEDWIISNLQDIVDSADSMAIRLVNEADVLLMQFRDGFRTEEQLMEEISGLLRRDVETIALDFGVRQASDFRLSSDTIDQACQFIAPVSEIHLPGVVV